VSGGGGGGERTEKATPKRLKEARKKGQIGKSPEIGAWFSLLAATFILPGLFSGLMDKAAGGIVKVTGIIKNPDTGTAMKVAGDTVLDAMKSILPLALTIALVAVCAAAAQGGIRFSAKLLAPQFKRLNPLSGLKRMFGTHALWELTKALLKTAALAVVVWMSVQRLVPTLYGSGSLSLQALVDIAVSTVLNVLRYAAVAGMVMAMADFLVVWKRNQKTLKMTKEEVKEEHKSQEGDPHRKGHIRSRQIAMARSRMMRDVPSADVILVNPTHVAVALKYDPARGAPRVVAKGADHVAARIRKLAEQNRIPMVRDVPLARTLYGSCEVGQEIPADLYKAVATVLAFIITLKKRGSATGLHTTRTLQPA